MFAVVYCPGFYIQCERLFRPELINRGLVIISGDQNDNLRIVASSMEALELGLKNGLLNDDLNQLLTKLVSENMIEVCCPNYELYADLSSRLMKSLQLLSPKISATASDEAVLELNALKHPHLESLNIATLADGGLDASVYGHYAIDLRNKLKQWLGISTVIGVGTTRTLAKVACNAAIKHQHHSPVVDLSCISKRTSILEHTAVSDITGISKKVAKRLSQINIDTALELSQAPKDQVRRYSSIIAERIAIELSGLSCKELEQSSIESTRWITSKRIKAHSFKEIKHVLNTQVISATAQLTNISNSCTTVTVTLAIEPLCTHDNTFKNSLSGELSKSISSVAGIRKLALELLESVWCDFYQYRSLSLSLGGLSACCGDQIGLFPMISPDPDINTFDVLPKAIIFETLLSIDKVGISRQHKSRLSPLFTTRWSEIARVS
jgi:DNA polymerase V